MNKFDVVIIGGGTAGTILARELGKYKRKTIILDRKDDLLEFSFNTLGSFINLKDFDLSNNVVAQKIESVVLHSRWVKRTLKGENLYILDKKKVHEEIIAAFDDEYVTVKTGVHIKDILQDENGSSYQNRKNPNVHIKDILQDENGNYTSVVDRNGEEYYGKIIVDASGTNGTISKKVGLREKKVKLATGVEYNVKYLGSTKELHLLSGKAYQGGYGWIFPLKNNRAIIGFGTFNEEIVKKLKERLNEVLEMPHIKKLVVKDNEKVEGGSIPITPVLEKFVLNNLVCVGDSVSQVNPIVGEGYKFIFEAALMASRAINKSLEKDNITYLNEYENEWKKRFSANYKRSKSAQEKVFKYTNNDFVMDLALFLMRLRSNDRIMRSLSGEYGLEKES